MSQSPILERRLDLVGRQLVIERDDDSPVMAEVTIDHGLAGLAQPGPAQDRVPEPQSRLPAVAAPATCRTGRNPRSSRHWYGPRASPADRPRRRPRGKSCDRSPAVASVVPSGLHATVAIER